MKPHDHLHGMHAAYRVTNQHHWPIEWNPYLLLHRKIGPDIRSREVRWIHRDRAHDLLAGNAGDISGTAKLRMDVIGNLQSAGPNLQPSVCVTRRPCTPPMNVSGSSTPVVNADARLHSGRDERDHNRATSDSANRLL